MSATIKDTNALVKHAIVVKFVGPSNNRGSFYRAKCAVKSVRFPIAHDYSLADNRRQAAITLANAMNWEGKLIEAQLDADTSVFVFDV